MPDNWYAVAVENLRCRERIADLERERAAIIAAAQRFQPGGSPPGGGPVVLVPWIIRSLAAQRDELRTRVATLAGALRAAIPQIERCSSANCDAEGHRECAFGLARKALRGEEEHV